MIIETSDTQFQSVNRAFTKQSSHFDEEDLSNPILQAMRNQVYGHLQKFIKPKSKILELNAGTGIDALHFARHGHQVFATDVSDGMIEQMRKKIIKYELDRSLFCQQVSYTQLDQVKEKDFDLVFSNFGGLNCIDDLTLVTRHLPGMLRAGAYVTWVIMPPVYLWELALVLKGNTRTGLRRLKSDGVLSHLEGEFFTTYYHSIKKIKDSFGPAFKLVKSEGLACITPPPHRPDFPARHPAIYSLLCRLDTKIKDAFPFNRWADHIIVTFQYSGT